MGRFYHGDIHGKFMFAVQPSDDPKFFIPSWSGFNEEDGLIEFLFKFDDLPNIKLGLATCRTKLGRFRKKLDEFFNKVDGYNEEMIAEEFKIQESKVRGLLEWYARYKIGVDILCCVEKNGQCYLEGEC